LKETEMIKQTCTSKRCQELATYCDLSEHDPNKAFLCEKHLADDNEGPMKLEFSPMGWHIENGTGYYLNITMAAKVVDYRLHQLRSVHPFTDEQIDLVRGMMVEYAQVAMENPHVKEEVYKVLMEMENEKRRNG